VDRHQRSHLRDPRLFLAEETQDFPPASPLSNDDPEVLHEGVLSAAIVFFGASGTRTGAVFVGVLKGLSFVMKVLAGVEFDLELIKRKSGRSFFSLRGATKFRREFTSK
jgi:hypothetical protein